MVFMGSQSDTFVLNGNHGNLMRQTRDVTGLRVAGHRVNNFGRVGSRVSVSEPVIDPVCGVYREYSSFRETNIAHFSISMFSSRRSVL